MKLFKRLTWFQWILLGTLILIFSGTTGLAWGYAAGVKEREKNLVISLAVDTRVQFDLGMKDFEAGNYDLARQRFEYVVRQEPDFPGAVDMLTKTLIRISEPVAQETEIAVLPTPSPTPDTRPVEELFNLAEEQTRNQDWKNLVQTIVSLRNIDPLYRAAQVDRMLFLGLRFSGIEKILDDGNLEGGVYDLALVERFAPLDYQVRIYQEWARLYQIGVSFWGVFPDKSVYYFSQLAPAAPYLRDLSGIYAKDRYRLALLQYGDRLSQNSEWCLAQEQYNLAYSLLEEPNLQPTLTYIDEQCLYGGVTPTPENSIVETPIQGITTTLTLTIDPNLTPVIEITPTPTQVVATPEPSPTTSAPTETPTPTPTPESAP